MISGEALDLFAALSALPEGERSARLEAATDHDRGEMEMIRRLLRQFDTSRDFLQSATVMWGAGDAERAASVVGVSDWRGKRLGSFTLGDLIGEGGMGIVFEAMQDSPRRRVAVKVMRGGVHSKSDAARFRREAEVLGRMNHPNIAAVFDARTIAVVEDDPTHVPYIAMEFVDGCSITRHAELRRMGVGERVRLVVEACRAIQHAHEQGIVHRDVSPSNVLVDSTGRVKIVDFGVARLSGPDSGATIATAGDRVLGKWSYASPEQALRGADQIDARSDVFSLGAVLYELAAGRPWLVPDERTVFELMRAIETDAPERWRPLGCAREKDLRIVVETAMQKERGRRYPSAAEFADELERWLRGEPVVARPMGRIERARRFVSMNRVISAAAAAVAISLAAGTMVSTVMAMRARSAQDQLVGTLHGVIEGMIAPLSLERGSIESRERLAEAIRDGIEQILRARPDDRLVQMAVARYEFEVGKLLGYPYSPNLGKRGEAVARFRAGLALIAPDGISALTEEKEAFLATDAAQMLGATLFIDELESQSEEVMRDALRACDRWIEASDSPQKWLDRRGALVLGLSQAVDDRGDRAGAIGVLEEAERMLRRHRPTNPGDHELFHHGSGWLGIGMSWHRFGEHERCIAAMESARGFLDVFAAPGRTDDSKVMNTGDPYRYIALSHAAMGNHAEAERLCSHALELCGRVLAVHPKRPDALIGFSMLHGQRAEARAAQGDLRAVGDAWASVEYRRLLILDDERALITRVAAAETHRVLGEVCARLMATGCGTDFAGVSLAGIADAALGDAEWELSRAGDSLQVKNAYEKIEKTRSALTALGGG